ncbi:protein AATF-like isoform X2 [Corticium candelabrum]|uniref:protein AATF-like isoform X2 n=1 Tax=Corticium candelabrum TaxID=121492 RepID=UPI002E269D2A|nr:protein AATF-like isoform X2 [Corticium candelabrum]
MAHRRKTLSEQLIALTNPEPKSFDEDGDGLNATLVCREDVEYEGKLDDQKGNDVFSSGQIGRRAAAFQEEEEDRRYAGRVTSRRRMREKWRLDDDDGDGVEEDIEARGDKLLSEFTESDVNQSGGRDSDVESEDSEMFSEEDDDDGDNDGDDDDDDQRKEKGAEMVDETENVRHFSEQNLKEEVEKGHAVKAQLKLWDCFLESRIKLQKLLGICNRFPQQDMWSEFQSNGGPELMKQLQRSQAKLRKFLDSLLSLQNTLLEQNKDITAANSKNSQQRLGDSVESDEEIASDVDESHSGVGEANGDVSDNESNATDDEVGKDENRESSNFISKTSNEQNRKRHRSWSLPRGVSYDQHVAKLQKSFDEYRDSVITKWDEKLRVATGKFSSKSFLSRNQSMMSRIKQILNDRERLIRRTQLKRSTYCVMGRDEDQEVIGEDRDAHLRDYDPEIFDDDDFYHQLLKELIERHATSASDPFAIDRQWLEVQRMRSKAHRKVDTKASKGRRIRTVNCLPPEILSSV